MKKNFLQLYNLCNCEIINLEEFSEFKTFKNCLTICRCFEHSEPYVCAISNVYKLKKMLDCSSNFL